MKKFLLIGLSLFILSCKQGTEVGSDTDDFKTFIENFDPFDQTDDINDLSERSFSEELAYTREMLAKLTAIDTTDLAFADKIDWRFAHSILRGNEIKQSQHRAWKRDPRIYMHFRSLGNLIEGPGDLDPKIEKLKERLSLVPEQLQNAQDQLSEYVPRFQELALFMAENSKRLFDRDLVDFASNTEQKDALMPLIEKSQKALDGYIEYLDEVLPTLPEAPFAMGTSTYNQMLQEAFLLEYTDETLWEFGQAKFNETVAELEALAGEIDPTKTWQQLASEIKSDYPEPHHVIAAHQLWVDSSKAHILNNKLIPIPWDEKVDVVPRAEYLRKTSYYGNFSRARKKDEDGIFTAQWMINPFEDQWDDRTKQEYLVEHDWGVIIVTAPHEAYGGHHVQSLYQMHNPRKIRRENGLSMFSEGWGLYNEQLMSETGFFPNKEIHLRQLQLRLWRNARVVYDVGMHTGKMSYEEAVSMMTDKVGFLRWAAQLEIDSAARSPGYFIGYFMGMSEILKMRELYRQKMGDDFTLSDFHERLLKIGNMPPKLMEESLLKIQEN